MVDSRWRRGALSRLGAAASLAAFAAAFPQGASGETWTLIKDSERNGYNDATYSQAFWQDSSGAAGSSSTSLAAGDDYRISRVLRLSPSSDYVFPGASLTMLKGGALSWTKSGKATIPNLIAEGGTIEAYTYLSSGAENSGWLYGYAQLCGKLTVTATADSPLRCTSRYGDTGGEIRSALYGASDAAIVIGNADSTRKASLWTFCDTANYHGTISVAGTYKELSGYPTATQWGPWFHYGVKFVWPEMPGTVQICGTNAVLFLPPAGTNTTIGALEMERDSVLRFDYSSGATPHNGTYAISDSLTLGDRVWVRAVYKPSTSVAAGARPVETPLLTGPVGARIDASKFVFDANTNYLKAASDGNAYPQAMAFKAVTDAATDRDTLYAVVKPKLVKNGTWSFNATSGSYSYADVTLAKGLEITWKYDPSDDATEKTRTAFLDVDDELAVEDGVVVRLNYKPVASTTGCETTNVVLRGPVGTRIDPAKFTFAPDEAYEPAAGKSVDVYPQRAHLVVTTDAEGRDSLCVVVEPIVVSVAGDSSSETEPPANIASTVFEDGTKWSDGRAPHGGAHYVLKHCGNFPVQSAEYVFPGKTLFHVGHYFLQRRSCDVTISNFVRSAGNSYSMGIGGSRIDLRGKLALKNNFSINTYASDCLNIHSDISGSGDIKLAPFWSTAWAGFLGLYGDNSAWTGRVVATGSKTDYTSFRCYTIRVRDGRGLGGALPEMAYDALYLGQRSKLYAEESLTLAADVNRGLWVTNVACVAVTNDCEMKVLWPVTLDGELIKEGDGTLALGGALKFHDGAGGVTDELPEDEGRRLFSLKEGAVKPLSANAFDGMSIVARAGTKIVLDLAAADAGLKASGLRNVRTRTPFALESGNSAKIPLVFEGATDEAMAALAGGAGLGLITVASDVADEVASVIDFSPVRTEKYVGFVERDAASVSGETTFRLVVKARGGMTVVVR